VTRFIQRRLSAPSSRGVPAGQYRVGRCLRGGALILGRPYADLGKWLSDSVFAATYEESGKRSA
jgi:hypothetical protein